MESEMEVGLFIDFENIRYGLLNNYGVEPDPQELMEKARKYGPVAVAFAYADFAQHPVIYRRKLEVAGITPRDVPRRGPDAPHKSSADMAMLMDIIDCLLDRPHVNTLILMTGDSDFIRVTARARHRFGKQVVIAGIPGSVSNDLIESANTYDPVGDRLEPLESRTAAVDDEERLLELVLWLDDHRPYMTFGFIRSHALSPHHGLGFTEDRVTDLLTQFKEHGILLESQRQAEEGRTLRTLELNGSHPRVVRCAKTGIPTFESEDRSSARAVGADDDPSESEVEVGEDEESPAAARPTTLASAQTADRSTSDGGASEPASGDAAPDDTARPGRNGAEPSRDEPDQDRERDPENVPATGRPGRPTERGRSSGVDGDPPPA